MTIDLLKRAKELLDGRYLFSEREQLIQEMADALEAQARRMAFIEAEANMGVLEGAAKAFDRRTDSLRGLTQLMSGGLYSAKLPGGPIKTELEGRRAHEQQQKLNDRMSNKSEGGQEE